MGFGGKTKNSAGKEEEKRQGQITAGTKAINDQFAMFDKPFYDKIGADYSAFANPQMADQYSDASKELTYALARQYGTLNTSEAAARNAKLAKAKADAEAQIADNSLTYQNQQRENVENQRAQLIAQVNASADPSQAASGALRQSEMLSQSPQFSRLSDMFSNVTEGLAAATYPYGLSGAVQQLFGGDGSTAKKGKAQTIVGGGNP